MIEEKKRMVEPSAVIKELYINRFGLETYNKYITQQKHSTWRWSGLQWYVQGCQIGTAMATMALTQGRKPVHGKPSTMATGTFHLDPKAKQQFRLDDTKYATVLRHNYADTGAGPLSKSVKSMSVNLGFMTLTMLSSPVAGFWNLPSFLTFFQLQAARTVGGETETMLKQNPLIWDVYQGTPYYATSYMQLQYNSLITYDYQDSRGHYLVRFAGIPVGSHEAKYLMPKEQAKEFWEGEYYDKKDALIPESLFELDYQERLSKAPQLYHLMYQMKPFDQNTGWEDRHAMKPWDCQKQLLGTLSITRLQKEEVSFDPNHMFPGLFVATPKDSYDTASIAYFRLGLYRFIQKLRNMRSACHA